MSSSLSSMLFVYTARISLLAWKYHNSYITSIYEPRWGKMGLRTSDICKQQSFRQACASAKSRQKLCCLLWVIYIKVYCLWKQTAKLMAWMCRFAWGFAACICPKVHFLTSQLIRFCDWCVDPNQMAPNPPSDQGLHSSLLISTFLKYWRKKFIYHIVTQHTWESGGGTYTTLSMRPGLTNASSSRSVNLPEYLGEERTRLYRCVRASLTPRPAGLLTYLNIWGRNIHDFIHASGPH